MRLRQLLLFERIAAHMGQTFGAWDIRKDATGSLSSESPKMTKAVGEQLAMGPF